MNKMDDFFKKRLENYDPAEDDWNIPSDDVFNKAKIHFPKKKKKKRGWLFFLPALLLVAGVGFYLGKHSINETRVTSPIATITSENKTEQNSPSPKNNISEIENIVDSKTIVSTKQQASEKTSINLTTKNNQTKSPAITPSSILKSSERIQSIGSTEIQNESKIKPASVQSSFIKNENQLKSENTELTLESTPITIPTKSIETITALPITEVSTKAAMIETKYPSLIENKNNVPAFQSPGIIIPKRPRAPKSEIGLAFGETIFRLIAIDGIIDETDDTFFSLDLNYTNPNFYYTRWFAKKWSLTTGIKYSYYDFDLNLSVNEEITQADIDEYISNDLNDVIDYGLRIKGNSVEAIPGVEVNAGDTINVQANIAQIGHEVQLPLFVNYHLRKNRFEWRFTAGIALNILNIKLDQGFVNLYKDGNLISTPEWEPELGWHLFGSLHAGASIRYHINERFNLGLSPRIDLTNPLFSSMEVGFYYRL